MAEPAASVEHKPCVGSRGTARGGPAHQLDEVSVGLRVGGVKVESLRLGNIPQGQSPGTAAYPEGM